MAGFGRRGARKAGRKQAFAARARSDFARWLNDTAARSAA